jgi:putative ABC transport system permease protein
VIVREIGRVLLTNRLRALLLTVQLGLTLAALANALNLLVPRLDAALRPTGLTEENAFVISSSGLQADFDARQAVRRDLTVLRSLGGVRQATVAMGVPFTGLQLTMDVSASQSGTALRTSLYHADEAGVSAFGLKLLAGREFQTGEILKDVDMSNDTWSSVIISSALSEALFGTRDGVGRRLSLDGQRAATVVGVVERLDGALPNMPMPLRERSMMVPQVLTLGRESTYLVRTAPGQLSGVMKSAEAALLQADHHRLIRHVRSLSEIRLQTYFFDFALSGICLAVLVLVLFANAMGIWAMCTLWVVDRRLELAVRRAVGATRWGMVIQLIGEALAVTSVGLLAGCGLAYFLNTLAMRTFATDRLSVAFVGWAAACLAVLVVVAAVGPAYRVARAPIAAGMREA